jgi:hypothetical protein
VEKIMADANLRRGRKEETFDDYIARRFLLQEEEEEQKVEPTIERKRLDLQTRKKNHDEVAKPIKGWWNKVSHWAVGEKADWGTAIEKGLGATVASVIGKYHLQEQDERDLSFLKPMEDQGQLEYAVQSLATIIPDLPFYFASGAATMWKRSPVGWVANKWLSGSPLGKKALAGFGMGALPETLRTMYIEALMRGKVNSFKEWWEILAKEGLEAGLKSGVVLSSAAVAPGIVSKIAPKVGGIRKTAWSFLSQWAAFVGVGAAVEGQMPTSKDAVNAGIVLGTLGLGTHGVRKAYKMTMNESARTGEYPSDIVMKIIDDPIIREKVLSDNITNLKPATGPKGPEPKKKATGKEKEAEKILVAPDKHISKDGKQKKNVVGDLEIVRDMATNTDSLNTWWARLRTAFLNKLHPIHAAMNEGKITTEGKVGPKLKMQTMSSSQQGIGLHFLEYGTLDGTATKITGEALTPLLKRHGLFKNPKKLEQFDRFALSKRLLELWETRPELRRKLGIENKNDAGIKRARKHVADGHKVFDPIFRDIFGDKGFVVRTLEYAVATGLRSKEDAARMLAAYKDYVPVYKARSMEPKDIGKKGLITHPYKRMRGVKEGQVVQFRSPVETLYLNTLDIIAMGRKNQVLVELLDLFGKNEFLKRKIHISKRVRKEHLGKEEIEKMVLKDTAIEKSELEGLQNTYEIYRRNPFLISETEVQIFRNGKREVWEVGKELAETLLDGDGTHAKGLSMFIKKYRLNVPTKTVRAGATLAMEFMYRNFFRDTFEAAVFSKNHFIPIWSSLQGMFEMVGNTKLYQSWVKSGAMFSGLHAHEQYIHKGVYGYLTSGKVRNLLKPQNWLEGLRVMSSFMENASRVGNFRLSVRRLKEEGKYNAREIEELAGLESKELTLDFHKIGTLIEPLNMMSAFLNARIRGWDRLAQAFKERPLQTLEKAFMFITVPSLLLYMNNRNDPAYQDLPQWRKDLFWSFPVHRGPDAKDTIIYSVPKPFSLGMIFGALPERMWEYIDKRDPEKFTSFAKHWWKDEVRSLGMLDIVKPAIEVYANRNMFFDRPLIPRRYEKLVGEYQYVPYTSEVAKSISRITHDIGLGVTPVTIDNYVNGWGGTLGRHALSLADEALIGLGIVPPTPQNVGFGVTMSGDDWVKNLTELPVIRAMFIRQPSLSAEPITYFWEKYNYHIERKNTYDKLMREFKVLEAQKFLPSVTASAVLSGSANAMNNLQKIIRNITVMPDKSIPVEEKRQMIDPLVYSIIAIAKGTIQAAGEAAKKYDYDK